MEYGMIEVFDEGYVRLVDKMGSDLSPVNSARVSYLKASKEMSERDKKLIGFLANAEPPHTSPFRHAVLQFEVNAPLMVARQWWKYIIGSDHDERVRDPFTAWNESSRRYVTEEPQFYVPLSDQWRSAPENSKQGSGEVVDVEIGHEAWKRLMNTVDKGLENYQWALDNGICAEQARLYLPAYGMYVRWYWTASLQGVIHFLNQRLAHDAQKEIQEFAQAVYDLTDEHFPVSLSEFLKTPTNA